MADLTFIGFPGGGGSFSLAPIPASDAAANANGATYSGGVFTGQPANSSFAGMMSVAAFQALDQLGVTPAQVITTTDATPTTVGSIDASDPDHVYQVQCSVTGKVAGGNAASYIRTATFKNVAGTVTQVGSTATPLTNEDDVAWNVGLSVVATSIIVTVTGAAATNIDWKLNAQVLNKL